MPSEEQEGSAIPAQEHPSGKVAKDDQLTEIFHQFKEFKNLEFLAISKPDETIESFSHSLPKITTRQREIMTFATRRGYFEIPKKITTREIALHFGISTAAVINHIQKTEKTLVKFHFS